MGRKRNVYPGKLDINGGIPNCIRNLDFGKIFKMMGQKKKLF